MVAGIIRGLQRISVNLKQTNRNNLELSSFTCRLWEQSVWINLKKPPHHGSDKLISEPVWQRFKDIKSCRSVIKCEESNERLSESGSGTSRSWFSPSRTSTAGLKPERSPALSNEPQITFLICRNSVSDHWERKYLSEAERFQLFYHWDSEKLKWKHLPTK